MVDRVPKALNLSTKRSRFRNTDDGERRGFPEEIFLVGFRPGPSSANIDRRNFSSHFHSSAFTSRDFPNYPPVPSYSRTFEAAFPTWEDTQPCDLRLKRAKVASPPQPLRRVHPTLVTDLTACVAISKNAATADQLDNSDEACLPISASSTSASESGMPCSSFASCSSFDPELSASSSSQVHFEVGFDGRRGSCGYQSPVKEVEDDWLEGAHGSASFVSSGYSSVASLGRQISETSLRSQPESSSSFGYQSSSSSASFNFQSRESFAHPSAASTDHRSWRLLDNHSAGSAALLSRKNSVGHHSRGNQSSASTEHSRESTQLSSINQPSRTSSAQAEAKTQPSDQESRVSLAQPKKKLYGRKSSTSSSLGYQSSSSLSNQTSSSAISSNSSLSLLDLHGLSSAASTDNPGSDDPSTYPFRRPRNLSVSLSVSPLSAPTPEPASKEGRLADYLADCLLKYGLCIVDSYMGTRAGQRILKDVKERANQMQEGRLMSDELESHTVRGDETMWLEAGTSLHIDNLVHRLDTVVRGLAHRLDATYQITSRTKAMVARYSGSGKCYVRHVDNHRQDGRCITCIYYLNQNYSSESDGGVLRMYPSRLAQSIDVEPKFDRVIFFWSDHRTPHEVLPAFRERYAITVWYFDEIERQQAKQRMGQSSGGES